MKEWKDNKRIIERWVKCCNAISVYPKGQEHKIQYAWNRKQSKCELKRIDKINKIIRVCKLDVLDVVQAWII